MEINKVLLSKLQVLLKSLLLDIIQACQNSHNRRLFLYLFCILKTFYTIPVYLFCHSDCIFVVCSLFVLFKTPCSSSDFYLIILLHARNMGIESFDFDTRREWKRSHRISKDSTWKNFWWLILKQLLYQPSLHNFIMHLWAVHSKDFLFKNI